MKEAFHPALNTLTAVLFATYAAVSTVSQEYFVAVVFGVVAIREAMKWSKARPAISLLGLLILAMIAGANVMMALAALHMGRPDFAVPPALLALAVLCALAARLPNREQAK